jgi:hypothetical protein
MLPTALVIGAQKAGTSWIDEYLRQRGDVVLPKSVKETFFFDRNFDRGIEWYSRHFPAYCSDCIEVAPSYMNDPETPERILSTLGQIPLICSLREPVQRTWSLYLHMRRYGMTRLPFGAALDEHPELLQSGRYAERLSPWFELFGADRMHVLIYEELQTDPQTFADDVSRAVGLPARDISADLRKPVNAAELPRSSSLAALGQWSADQLRRAGWYPVVTMAKNLGLKQLFFGGGRLDAIELGATDRRRVQAHFAPELDRLERLLGRPLETWRHPE